MGAPPVSGGALLFLAFTLPGKLEGMCKAIVRAHLHVLGLMTLGVIGSLVILDGVYQWLKHHEPGSGKPRT